MKLSVIERMMLGGLMTNYQGSFVNLKLVREGREALSFNEEENKDLTFVKVGNNMTWNMEASIKYQAVDITLGSEITKIIKELLQKLNDEAKLTEQHLSIYEKFMEPNLKLVQ